ncbi:MAG: tetratricopeptide repeat protein [Treponemataceae bacterium]
MVSKSKFTPKKALLKKKYQEYAPSFEKLLSGLLVHLEKNIKLKSPPSYRARVKSFDSYYRKLLKYPPKEACEDLPTSITDIVAIRIICSFLDDLSVVERILEEKFEVVEIERKGSNRNVLEFGYVSVHMLLGIPESLKKGLNLPKGLVFEVQIRTILQDAWAEVEHELVYKAEFSPFDLPLKRKMAAINASLSLADIIFQEIRDYQNKLNLEVEKRRATFYSLADEFSTTFFEEDGANAKNPAEEETNSIYEPESIDDLVLKAISAHNSGDFEKAEKIYTKIIDRVDNNVILSVIFKHRGMAYFGQGKYEKSLKDFKRSVGYDDGNFRSLYYVGIALTLLGRHAEAIEYFSKSLEINPYQAHASFRRALSHFHEENYVDALSDLDKATDLGYTASDAQKLRIEISKKMQML